jgi:hypothetical protein
MNAGWTARELTDHGELAGLRPAVAAAHRLLPADVQVEEERTARVVGGQGGKHPAVTGGRQDALEKDVTARVQHHASGVLNQVRCEPARLVPLTKPNAPQVILLYQRVPTPEPSTELSDDSALARPTRAPDHDSDRRPLCSIRRVPEKPLIAGFTPGPAPRWCAPSNSGAGTRTGVAAHRTARTLRPTGHRSAQEDGMSAGWRPA